MNIFYLDESPLKSAIYSCDKHCVKMIVESAQLLCTAHRMLDGYQKEVEVNGRKRKRWVLDDLEMQNALYQASHYNHPSAVWVRESSQHYHWLYNHFLQLMTEYERRYNRQHKTTCLIPYLYNFPKNLQDNGFTPPPQAMPDDVKHADTVTAYRQYYIKHKAYMANWTNREEPDWFTEGVNNGNV